MKNIISVTNLTYTYPKSHTAIFCDVSFDIPQNALVAFIAPNGTGKTTMMNLITGQLPFDSGKVSINNKNLQDIQNQVYNYVSILTPTIKTPQYLTVEEALKFSLNSYNNYTEERYLNILDIFGLLEHKNKQIKQLSSGLERRAELAQTLSNDSKILILDEPCNALDFSSVKDTVAIVKKMWNLGKTIIYTTHQFNEIENIYTHVMVISHNGIKIISKDNMTLSLADYYRKVYEVNGNE